MKKSFLTAAILLSGIAAFAQPDVRVLSMEKVSLPQGVCALKHTISPDGTFVALSDGSAISKVDLSSGEFQKIADGNNVFQLTVSPDGTTVAYNEPVYKDRLRYVSLRSANVATGKVKELVKPTRQLNSGISLSDNAVNAVENGKLRTKKIASKKAEKDVVVSINYGHLDVTIDGVTTTIDPQGRGSYLWPQLSPDGTKIVYWCCGEGCFVCNLDGSDVKPLGVLRAAVWAGNDMIVGMNDVDDGVMVLSSSLVATDLQGNKVELTPDSVIAMYPSASADGSKITFTDAADQLYILTIQKK